MKRHIVEAVVIVLFFVGSTLFYCYYEKWNVVDSLLFVVSAVTTVGFGFNVPTDDGSRIFTIFVILFGILYVLSCLLEMMHFVLRFVQHRTAYTLKRLFLYSVALVVIVLIIGAVAFSTLQKFSFPTALYFAVETSTTLGLGDLPVNAHIKLFLIFYLTVSTIVIAFAFENFTNMNSKIELHKKKRSILFNEADLVDIVKQARQVMSDAEFKLVESKHDPDSSRSTEYFDLGDDLKIGQYQFVVCVLAHLGTINVEKEVVPWLKKFNELDVENNGYLTKEILSSVPKRENRAVETEVWADERRSQSISLKNQSKRNNRQRSTEIYCDNDSDDEEDEESQ